VRSRPAVLFGAHGDLGAPHEREKEGEGGARVAGTAGMCGLLHRTGVELRGGSGSLHERKRRCEVALVISYYRLCVDWIW
jgi:hypothetical protein